MTDEEIERGLANLEAIANDEYVEESDDDGTVSHDERARWARSTLLNLGQLREQTKDLPDDTIIVVEEESCEASETVILGALPQHGPYPSVLRLSFGQVWSSEIRYYERLDIDHGTIGRSSLLPDGHCGVRGDHEKHVHDSPTLGRLNCSGLDANRLPGRAERQRRKE